MSPLRLIVASLAFHRRANLAVALGVAAGTAVLVGALLVGDSMRGSLRDLTVERLGRVDEALVADRFFRAALADELAAAPRFKEDFARAVPAIILRASLERPGAAPPRRANQVNLVGCDGRFWGLGDGGPATPPAARQIVLNRPLADALGVEQGGTVLLRLPQPGAIPAESPLGRDEETVGTERLTVSEIVPAEGLGRFGLRPSQQPPRNAYVDLAWLQFRLGQQGKANAILAAGSHPDSEPPAGSHERLQAALRPSLEDLGLRVELTDRGYLNMTSDRMILAPAAERAILAKLGGLAVQPALTYLANTIACGQREVPYSTVTAIDFAGDEDSAGGLPGPLRSPGGEAIGPIGDGRVVLNAWAAERLGAEPGATIRLTFFRPESTHGRIEEETVELKLAAVAALDGAADDPALTPEVAGVTDKLTMDQWNPPFPYDAGRIGDDDEQYWEDHRATPKAFVSLATGRRLWGSRFGRTTSIRVGRADGMTAADLAGCLHPDPAAFGLAFQPAKAQGLAASAGTTPFNVLFLAFSFFIIAAAVMLVAILFALGVGARAAELGILAAVGFSRRRAAGLLLGEGLAVAAAGGLLGVLGGIGYAALMLFGLQSSAFWLPAIGTPFLRLHWTATSLAAGYAAGVGVSMAAIWYAVRRAGRIAPRRLLAGQATAPLEIGRPARRGRRLPAVEVVGGLLILAALAAAAAFALFSASISEEAQAGAFFAAGAAVLCGALLIVWSRLRRGATGAAVAAGRGNLARMALRNAARSPGRSTLTIALVASTSFLVIAIGAFRVDPTGKTPRRDDGTGGFALVGQSDQPVYHDFTTPEGRAKLGFSPAESAPLAGVTAFALRVRGGEDASCLNLYKPRQPRMLGLPRSLIERGGFAWAGQMELTADEAGNPWRLLERDLGLDADGVPRVPVVIEKNTANYALHLWKGVGETFDVEDDQGRPIRLVVVGLLSGSIFQGDLLVSEEALLRHFPDVAGYRFFLIEAPPGKTAAVGRALESGLGDFGFAAETTGDRLDGFMAVQNTYLSTFQSLGGLGLLLGTLGLAAVELRNVMERRGELALMRAAGFRRRWLAWLVLLENAVLLLIGLAAGALAALVAVLPHLFGRGATLPFGLLAAMLGLVLAAGLLAGLAAVRAVLGAPLLGALREEH